MFGEKNNHSELLRKGSASNSKNLISAAHRESGQGEGLFLLYEKEPDLLTLISFGLVEI